MPLSLSISICPFYFVLVLVHRASASTREERSSSDGQPRREPLSIAWNINFALRADGHCKLGPQLRASSPRSMTGSSTNSTAPIPIGRSLPRIEARKFPNGARSLVARARFERQIIIPFPLPLLSLIGRYITSQSFADDDNIRYGNTPPTTADQRMVGRCVYLSIDNFRRADN